MSERQATLVIPANPISIRAAQASPGTCCPVLLQGQGPGARSQPLVQCRFSRFPDLVMQRPAAGYVPGQRGSGDVAQHPWPKKA